MNPVERVIRRVDAAQQRHRAPAFVFGVIKKYGDDNGGVLASNLAQSAFVTVFPLLLILVTVLVKVASGAASLRHEVLKAVARQFPLVGEKLTENIHALNRSSVTSLIVGLLVLAWGAKGLAQAGLFTMEQVWNLPGPARPGYLPRLGRCALFLGVLAVGVLASTLLTGLVAQRVEHGVTERCLGHDPLVVGGAQRGHRANRGSPQGPLTAVCHHGDQFRSPVVRFLRGQPDGGA